jgi:hypothetical protein
LQEVPAGHQRILRLENDDLRAISQLALQSAVVHPGSNVSEAKPLPWQGHLTQQGGRRVPNGEERELQSHASRHQWVYRAISYSQGQPALRRTRIWDRKNLSNQIEHVVERCV